MNQVVQAKCPACKKVLRIPAAWIAQPIRCKYCGVVIQSKQAARTNHRPSRDRQPPPIAPAAAQPPPRQAVPPAPAPASPWADVVASAPTAAADAFEFVEDQPAAPPAGDLGIVLPSAYRRRSRWKGPVVTGIIVLAALGLGGYAWHVQQQGDDNHAAKAAKPTAKAADDTGIPANAQQYPRRALAVCVSNYWYANPVSYGEKSRSLGAVFRKLCDALHVPKDQMTELSDAAAQPVAPTKPVIQDTVTAFLDTCRPEDRILLLFVGHAVELGKEAYLAPIEGELKTKASLIPLRWLYDGLARCKARQKVLVLDVCRYDPGRGLERPGSGPMGKVLSAAVQQPPAGVQVWSACSEGEYSYEGIIEAEGSETAHGGFFLSEVYETVGPSKKRVRVGVQNPDDPLPVEALAAGREVAPGADRGTTAEVAEWLKQKQTPRLAGLEPRDGAPYNPDAPAPPPAVVKKPLPSEGPAGVAGRQVVQAILRETGEDRPREGDLPLTADSLPPFDVKKMDTYKDDGKRTPLREAVLAATKTIDKHLETFREEFRGKEDDAKIKEQIFKQQKPVAKAVFELQESIDNLAALEKDLSKEKSKRWKANYDFVLARLKQRAAYMDEYDALLGQIRKETLPARDPAKYTGWRLAARERITSSSAKEKAAEAKKTFLGLAKKYKGTPWEILARREAVTNIGLRWEVTP